MNKLWTVAMMLMGLLAPKAQAQLPAGDYWPGDSLDAMEMAQSGASLGAWSGQAWSYGHLCWADVNCALLPALHQDSSPASGQGTGNVTLSSEEWAGVVASKVLTEDDIGMGYIGNGASHSEYTTIVAGVENANAWTWQEGTIFNVLDPFAGMGGEMAGMALSADEVS